MEGRFLLNAERFPDPPQQWTPGLPVLPIPAVYLLHGKGGSPVGTVRKIESILGPRWPGLDFLRPKLPHSDPAVLAEESVEFLHSQEIRQNSLLLGVSLGGLVAAKLQEIDRPDLQVLAISSPTWADGVRLETNADRRLAFYSSSDSVIAGRVDDWPKLASFLRDFAWLSHNTDEHLTSIARLFDWYIEGMLPQWADSIRSTSFTKQERDEIVWASMARSRENSKQWNPSRWNGGRPRTFAEIGEAMEAGWPWHVAWGDWQHEFVFLKDARCLSTEPPHWFAAERRAMMAGTAEFFSRLYGLTKPDWTEKPEYFLPELEYMSYLASEPDDPDFMVFPPESEDALYRMMARSPKEMLRRNVVFEARSLTVL
jgi:hypothetical protein